MKYSTKIIKMPVKKPQTSLTKEQIKSLGWNHMCLMGSEEWFSVHFSGSSWYQLDFDKENGWIKISYKKKKGEEERVRYDGPCKNFTVLKYLCKLLNIAK